MGISKYDFCSDKCGGYFFRVYALCGGESVEVRISEENLKRNRHNFVIVILVISGLKSHDRFFHHNISEIFQKIHFFASEHLIGYIRYVNTYSLEEPESSYIYYLE